MNKRGQFFLVAAIVIVGIVIGLSSTLNVAVAGDSSEQFYDLSSELGFETRRVIDYGVYRIASSESLPDLEENIDITRNFINDYAQYINQEEVVFVYGNPRRPNGLGGHTNGLRAYTFERTPQGVIGISTGYSPTTTFVTGIEQTEANFTVIEENDMPRRVRVLVDSTPYVFNLRRGENFFFVLIREENNEQFVATG